MKKHLRNIGLLVALALPLFFLTPYTRDLWLPDEPRYAEIAMEMADTGNWIIPHLHGELYTEKPPLYFWLLAGSAKFFGNWRPFAMIFPAAVSSLGVIIIMYGFATLLFNRKIGFLSALMLMTSILFIGVGQFVRMDMFLLLCFSISLCSFYRLHVRTTPYDDLYMFLFFLAAALATLTKGPIGIGLPGLILVLFLFWTRNFRVLRKMRLFWGSFVYLAIVLAWFVPAIRQEGWDYAYLIVIKQNLGRVYNSFSHARPWYFYLHTLPWITLPWFPFFVSAMIHARRTPITSREQDTCRFLWIWWGTTFVFFSLVSGKLEIYLLPLLPPTAILTARFWLSSSTSSNTLGKLSQRLTLPAYILAGSLLIASIALILQGESARYWGGILLLEAIGGLLIYAAVKSSPRLLFAVVWSITPLILLYGAITAVPIWNRQLSLQSVIQNLKRMKHGEESLALWEFYYPIQYYVPFRISVLRTHEEKLAFFSSPIPIFCLTREKYLDRIQRELKKPVYVLGTYRLAHKNFLLVSQFPRGKIDLTGHFMDSNSIKEMVAP
jgi:4-amino-4-deoxy-L-arabinose transferase-like glycosyltransferase